MTGKLAEKDRPTQAPRAAARRPVEPAAAGPERAATAGRVPFVVLVVGLLAGGLVALLLLNVALAQDSYRLHQLQERTSLLAEQKRSLQRQVSMEAAPKTLAEKAESQGMVPAGEPAYLYLETGKTRGGGEPAGRGEDGD